LAPGTDHFCMEVVAKVYMQILIFKKYHSKAMY